MLKILEMVSNVGSQGEYGSGLGGVIFIQQHHLGYCLAGTKPA